MSGWEQQGQETSVAEMELLLIEVVGAPSATMATLRAVLALDSEMKFWNVAVGVADWLLMTGHVEEDTFVILLFFEESLASRDSQPSKVSE